MSPSRYERPKLAGQLDSLALGEGQQIRVILHVDLSDASPSDEPPTNSTADSPTLCWPSSEEEQAFTGPGRPTY